MNPSEMPEPTEVQKNQSKIRKPAEIHPSAPHCLGGKLSAVQDGVA